MAEPAQIQAPQRPNLVSVGTIVWLSQELMLFAALFAMYFTVRQVTLPDSWPPDDVHLNIPFASVNTLVLVSSSLTCQLGVFAAVGIHRPVPGLLAGGTFGPGVPAGVDIVRDHEGLVLPADRDARGCHLIGAQG